MGPKNLFKESSQVSWKDGTPVGKGMSDAQVTPYISKHGQEKDFITKSFVAYVDRRGLLKGRCMRIDFGRTLANLKPLEAAIEEPVETLLSWVYPKCPWVEGRNASRLDEFKEGGRK